MNAPVLGKIGKHHSPRGDGLIGTVVVLEVPTAPPNRQSRPSRCSRGQVSRNFRPRSGSPASARAARRFAGVDMLGMAGQQVPELDEP